MHDPHSLAWSIKFPWYHHALGMRHWSTFLDIWHYDPETDGSDDSCDWSGRKIKPSPAIEKELRFMASMEAKYPYYFTNPNCGPGDAATMLWCFWCCILWRTNYRVPWIVRVFKPSRRRIPPKRMWMEAVRLAGMEHDNVTSLFRINEKDLEQRVSPGLNDDEDASISKPSLAAEDSYPRFLRMWSLLAREQRHWWQHPQWHVHHWHLRFPWLQNFKRWLFSKCSKCGKGFSYGYCPTTYSWHGTGPQWFRSEQNVQHHDCAHPKSDGAQAVTGS